MPPPLVPLSSPGSPPTNPKDKVRVCVDGSGGGGGDVWGGRKAVQLCAVVALFELHACFFFCMVAITPPILLYGHAAVKFTQNGLRPVGSLTRPSLLNYWCKGVGGWVGLGGGGAGRHAGEEGKPSAVMCCSCIV